MRKNLHPHRKAVMQLAERNPRARANMAVRMLPGGGLEFDTPEELIDYQRRMAGVAPVAAPRSTMSAPMPVSRQSTAIPRAGSFGSGLFQTPAHSPAPRPKAAFPSGKYKNSYSVIAASIGGTRWLCGDASNLPADAPEGKFKAVLSSLGIDQDTADTIADLMREAGCAKEGTGKGFTTTPEQQAHARQILFGAVNIQCVEGVGAQRVSCNPRGRRNPVSWTRAY